jgi:hypothetical protein
MISNKKTENEELKQTISIDEIICMVQDFNYDIDNSSMNKKPEQTKNKKPKSSEQIQKDNLFILLKKITRLKGSIETEKSSRETKIKKLYELLKIKLGVDLYLFNVLVVADFLQGYKSTEENKLDKSIKILFDIILLDIEYELKDLLPSNLDINLFNDEDNIKEIVKSVTPSINEKEDNKNYITKLSNFYVYLVLKNRSRDDFYRQLFKIELLLLENIAAFNYEEKNEFLLKLLSKTFTDSNPKNKARTFVYLHFTTYIEELIKEVNSLSQRLSESHSTNAILTSQVRQIKEIVKTKDITIEQLTVHGHEKDTNIENLKIELKDIQNRYVYDVNKFEKQIQEFRANIIMQLQNNLRIELNDLNDFANGLQKGDGEILKMYVTNIQQSLNSL